MKRLTGNHVDMLYRVALAEFFTSPTTAAKYDRLAVIASLEERALVRRDGVLRLTDAGRAELERRLSGERAEMLAQLRAARARRGGRK